MERLKEHTYKISDSSKENLKSLGFVYSHKFSNDEDTYYTYRFPVYKNRGKTLLECELIINTASKTVNIGVFDTNQKVYAPFYSDEYSSGNKVVTYINRQILRKFKEFDIRREH